MKLVVKKKEDKKKLWVLAVLGVVAAVALYTQVFSGDSSQAPVAHADTPPAALPTEAVAPSGGPRVRVTGRRNSGAFVPVLRSARPEDRPDPTRIDPTLRLDLLAKVQGVTLEGGSRNLFQFGVAPPPPTPATPLPMVGKIPINQTPAAVTPPPPSGPPPPPPPPVIPLKYYGYSNAKGESRKKAFFLDGEDIIVAWEGDTIKNRYKVIHVGVNSVEVEDTQFKNKQTLPLAEEAAG